MGSLLSSDCPPSPDNGLQRTTTVEIPPIEKKVSRRISDSTIGYASRLPRQASVGSYDVKRIRPVSEMRESTAGLEDGTFLYVIMVGDPDNIRLIHEEHLVLEGALAGHSSLVERD